MYKLLEKFDDLAGINQTDFLSLWLDRIAFTFLTLMILSAPHSIAATQISWLLGMIFWVPRLFVRPRPKFLKTVMFLPLFVFFGWTVFTAVLSYAPDISIGKLGGASLFLIFFFTINNLRTIRSVKFLASALIFSCMVVSIWTPTERAIGRGIRVVQTEKKTVLARAGLKNGDAILRVNGKSPRTPQDVLEGIKKNGEAIIEFERSQYYWQKTVKMSALADGETASDTLGIIKWKTNRSWRSTGFYSHYVTFSEVLQLILSLTFGLLVASFGNIHINSTPNQRKGAVPRPTEVTKQILAKNQKGARFLDFLPSTMLFLCIAFMGSALVLTSTRASQAAFLISALSVVLLNGKRKLFVIVTLITIPLTIAGVLLIQQSRGVGILDPNDASTQWRKVVYNEGLALWTKDIRNLTIGVGMDSIKRFKDEWHLFDDGKIHPGHFHSTPLQFLVERGLPALVLWLWIFGTYIRTLFDALRRKEFLDWLEKGILLGCMGGAIGFFVSGIVHYNYGDSEVVTAFYLLMALGLRITTIKRSSKEDKNPKP